jgi:hypothetical protein
MGVHELGTGNCAAISAASSADTHCRFFLSRTVGVHIFSQHAPEVHVFRFYFQTIWDSVYPAIRRLTRSRKEAWMNLRALKFHPLLFVIFLLTFLLFFGGPNYDSDRLIKIIWDTGHVVLFALSAFVLLRLPPLNQKKLPFSICVITIFCLGAGFITEALQPIVGRSFETKDILNDLLGGYLGWSIAVAFNKQNKKLIRIFALPIILSILFFVLNPIYRAAFNDVIGWSQFPVLSDFETPYELDCWNAGPAIMHLDTNQVRHGRKAMRIDLAPGIYPGISLETFRHNWLGYSWVQFSLYNTTTHELLIYLKIYDRSHTERGYEYSDRFNRTLPLMPGWNDYNISLNEIAFAPQDRTMDLSKIASFSLFLSSLDKPMTLYLDYLRLSR